MTQRNDEKMITDSKTVIITGGNTGLGYQCAKNIAECDKRYHVLIACRNLEKAAHAIKKLKDETGNPNIYSVELDLASLSSIRSFYKEFSLMNLPPLYAVVCNAGIGSVGTRKKTIYTKDGFEMILGVNHLGHFLLTNLLLQRMSDSGRIVFVSSDVHTLVRKYINAKILAYPDQNSENRDAGSEFRRYATSKLCNIYCTYELAERIRTETDKNITVNAFNPGFMPTTGLIKNGNPIIHFLSKQITLISGRLDPSEKSGKSLATLVTSPQLNTMTGKYIDRGKEIKSSLLSYNKDYAKELWKTSVELVSLQKNETIF